MKQKQKSNERLNLMGKIKKRRKSLLILKQDNHIVDRINNRFQISTTCYLEKVFQITEAIFFLFLEKKIELFPKKRRCSYQAVHQLKMHAAIKLGVSGQHQIDTCAKLGCLVKKQIACVFLVNKMHEQLHLFFFRFRNKKYSGLPLSSYTCVCVLLQDFQSSLKEVEDNEHVSHLARTCYYQRNDAMPIVMGNTIALEN